MDEEGLYDVIIIGGGPAGLTAALYLARAYCRVLVVEKVSFGGQITATEEVVNYPGVKKTGGRLLAEAMREQAASFGAEFIIAEAIGLELDGDVKTVHTTAGDFYGFGILIAAGAHQRKAGFSGEAEFTGRGVSYCAACDGGFFKDKEVFVIGGGYAAAEESVFLTRYAKHVTVLIRGAGFSCAAATAAPALEHPKITVLTHTSVAEVSGKYYVNRIVYKNSKTGEETVRSAGGESLGVFVFAGYEPESALVKDLVELDERGYIVTDRAQKTSFDGVYAAGDVCAKDLRQVVTAVGDGAVAAQELEKYAQKLRESTGLMPRKPAIKPEKPDRAAD